MDFEWSGSPFQLDDLKREKLLSERGIDLKTMARLWDGFVIERADDRNDYGEDRFVAIGQINDVVFIVVYTWRDNVRRLITAWKAGSDDSAQYNQEVLRLPKG